MGKVMNQIIREDIEFHVEVAITRVSNKSGNEDARLVTLIDDLIIEIADEFLKNNLMYHTHLLDS